MRLRNLVTWTLIPFEVLAAQPPMVLEYLEKRVQWRETWLIGNRTGDG